MPRFRTADHHRVDCGRCYGMGCSSCGGKGWHETDEGREAREAAEDRWADDERDRRLCERDDFD